MPMSSNGEIIQDFIAELKNYIPTMVQNIDCLKKDPDQKDALEELHRLVHTIKGASSLVGITGLSQIAFRMEETLDEIMVGTLSFTDELFTVMSQTVAKFETYSTELIESEIDQQSLFEIDEIAASLDTSASAADPEEIVESVETDKDETFQFPQDELLESFYQEAEEHLQDLGQVLIALESQVTDRVKISSSHREHVRQIRRSVHTIKGAAAIMGVTEVSSWAHHLEDLLDWLFEEALEITPEIIAILAESSDLLEQIVTNPKDIDPQHIDALKEQFKLIVGTRLNQIETEFCDQRLDVEVQKNSETEQPVNEEITFQTSPGSFEANSTPLPPPQSNTLRVDMGRVDSLVKSSRGVDHRVQRV